MSTTSNLKITDGNGASQNLQVNTGATGLVGNSALTSIVNDTTEIKKVIPTDFTWGSSNKGALHTLNADLNRRSVIIHNSSSNCFCYVLLKSNNTDTTKGFGTINNGSPPEKYTFVLDPGGTYFGDTSTAALAHGIYVASGSNLTGAITITEIS